MSGVQIKTSSAVGRDCELSCMYKDSKVPMTSSTEARKKNCMTLKSITVERKRNYHGEKKKKQMQITTAVNIPQHCVKRPHVTKEIKGKGEAAYEK